MFHALLFLHILIAIVMAGIAALSLVAILRKRPQGLPRQARRLATLLLTQVASGSLLGLLSPEFSAAEFCINVTLYIGAYLLVQLAIFLALRQKTSFIFPHRPAWASAGISFVFLALVLLVRVPIS